MHKVFQMTVAAAIGIAALSPNAPAQAGNSDIGAGLVGFGIGAILGSMMGPPEVYFVPPLPDYYGPVVYGPPTMTGRSSMDRCLARREATASCLPALEDSGTARSPPAGAWTGSCEGGKERGTHSRCRAKV